jgi:hypothetical protein
MQFCIRNLKQPNVMKFNFLKKTNTILKNYEGAPSYQLSPEMELYSATVSSLLHDSFYEKAEDRLIRLQQLIEKVSPEYCAKLAVYARRSMNLRSVPIVLSVELAKKLRQEHGSEKLLSK